MALLLQDSSGNIWSTTATAGGILVTTPSSGSPVPSILFLSDTSGQVWQVNVTTGGLLQQIPGSIFDTPIYQFFDLETTPTNWALYVNTLGILQTKTGFGTGGWVQNGYGAGTDNRVVGGGGGFMAYPQPATGPRANQVPLVPENFGGFGATNEVSWNGIGNWFQITNPGRSANS